MNLFVAPRQWNLSFYLQCAFFSLKNKKTPFLDTLVPTTSGGDGLQHLLYMFLFIQSQGQEQCLGMVTCCQGGLDGCRCNVHF